MPWSAKDAQRHTKKAKSAKKQRQWEHVANSMLERTGDEGAAVRAANSVVKKGVGKRKRRGKQQRSKRSVKKQGKKR
jgi:uncharacterized protein YdaT